MSTGSAFLQTAVRTSTALRREGWDSDVALSSPTWHPSLLCCRNLVCLSGWAANWPLCRPSLTQPLPSWFVSSSPPSLSAPATWPPPPSSSPFWLQWWVPAFQNALIRTVFSSSAVKTWLTKPSTGSCVPSGVQDLKQKYRYVCAYTGPHRAQFNLSRITAGEKQRD